MVAAAVTSHLAGIRFLRVPANPRLWKRRRPPTVDPVIARPAKGGSDDGEPGTPPVREEPPFTHPAVRGDLDDTV